MNGRLTALLSFFAILLSASALPNQHSHMTIKTLGYHEDAFFGKDPYISQLRAALDITIPEFGPYEIMLDMNQFDQVAEFERLKNGDIDVIWSLTSTQREREFIPIRFPLMRGLMGYRVLVINPQSAPWQKGSVGLDQLRSLVAIQGKGWPDVEILDQNGFIVGETPSISRAYALIKNQRFDFFPRSISEVFFEADKYQFENGMGLIVAENLGIHYPTAMFFFVSPNNIELATRFNIGMRTLEIQGLRQRFVSDNQYIQQIRLGLQNRLFYELDNPFLTSETIATLERCCSRQTLYTTLTN